MGTVSIVVMIPLAFAAVNLFAQLAALEAVRRHDEPKLPRAVPGLEHPYYNRVEGMPRTRTDRHDLQLGLGHDYAAPDVEQSVWPRDPRI